MRTAISGRVTRDTLADAELFAGITPSVLVANDVLPPPLIGLNVEVIPLCRMLDRELAIRQRDYTLCQTAEAVIITDGNEHMAGIARGYGLLVYES